MSLAGFLGKTLLAAAAVGMIFVSGIPGTVYGEEKNTEYRINPWDGDHLFLRNISLEVDGEVYGGDGIVAERGEVFLPKEAWRSVFGISVLEYPDGRILIQGGNVRAELKMDEDAVMIGQTYRNLQETPKKMDGKLYLPLSVAEEVFGYEKEWPLGSYRVRLVSEPERSVCPGLRRTWMLPDRYDYRDVGRAPKVRNQGEYGTCWSFASLAALESSGLPKDGRQYSPDHMSLHNSFSLEQEEGGEYTMSMAYLLAWQGPVLEEEDPYGDGLSPDGLEPAVHVQEIRILPEKDYDSIKEAVFLYGGVQSSLYTSMVDGQSQSVYYNDTASAYCYMGSRYPNHDVVIVGWDDHYPRENFQIEVEGDGAFLCANSWGDAFGDSGYFYVSYYDRYIGETSLVYTGVTEADPDSRIYQSDLCGWVGQMGYGTEDVYGANVYTAQEEETLYAAGFYATGEDTSYEIYVATGLEEGPDFRKRELAAEGTVKYSGYYTIPFKEPVKVKAGERFAVILHVKTPGAIHPLAIEYQADEATKNADMTDGEGYISAKGVVWESSEKTYGCNLCLKAYTRKESEDR